MDENLESTIEIDLEIFQKEELIYLIKFGNDNNYTFSQTLEKILMSYLENNKEHTLEE